MTKGKRGRGALGVGCCCWHYHLTLTDDKRTLIMGPRFWPNRRNEAALNADTFDKWPTAPPRWAGSVVGHSWKLLKCASIKPRHIFASPRRTPHSFRCPAKCALFLEQSFAPTSACRLQLRLNFVLLSLFLFSSFFYNKLDLRKNRSPFISGGLMVSRRTAHNKNTRLVRRAR